MYPAQRAKHYVDSDNGVCREALKLPQHSTDNSTNSSRCLIESFYVNNQ